MAKITRAAAHLSAEEVKQRMKTAKTAMYRQRWLIIYTALVAPRKAEAGIGWGCSDMVSLLVRLTLCFAHQYLIFPFHPALAIRQQYLSGVLPDTDMSSRACQSACRATS